MFVYTIQPVVNPIVKPVVQPGLTSGWMFVYTIQPVPAVSCKRGLRVSLHFTMERPVRPSKLLLAMGIWSPI